MKCVDDAANIVEDNDDAAADQRTGLGLIPDQRTGSWSIPSTSRVRGEVELTQLRGSSRSTDDVRQITDDLARHSAGELSLRLSGCGAERSVKAKRRVIKVKVHTGLQLHRRRKFDVFCVLFFIKTSYDVIFNFVNIFSFSGN